MIVQPSRYRIRSEVGENGRGQPQEGGCGEITPEVCHAGHLARPSVRRRTARNVPTEASMARSVDSTRTTRSANQSSDSTSRLPITPTPAGTKSSDRLARMTVMVGRRSLASAGLMRRIAMSRASPRTGPGMDRPRPRTVTSPISWQARSSPSVGSMRIYLFCRASRCAVMRWVAPVGILTRFLREDQPSLMVWYLILVAASARFRGLTQVNAPCVTQGHDPRWSGGARSMAVLVGIGTVLLLCMSALALLVVHDRRADRAGPPAGPIR